VAARFDPDLKLTILGRFALVRAGREIVLPRRKTRALLAFLGCAAGKYHGRDRLIGLLWGERSESQARQSLRHALTDLRKAMPGDLLQADREQVCLDASFPSDLAEFRRLLAAGDGSSLAQAVTLHSDGLLSGFSIPEATFTDWLEAERTELRNLAIGALATLMDQAEADRRAADLITFAKRALALDPYREQAHRHLLRGLAMAGNRNEAMAHYGFLEHMLRQDLGVEPEPETRALLEAIRSGAPASGAQPPALDGGGRSTYRPSIAVLPFEDIGGDATSRRLAEGMTEDIITDLARFRDLDVIARNSASQYRGRAADVRLVGRELNVRYVLEGSIQRQKGQIRVSAKLVDAASGGALWSERWDRPDEDFFAVQSEVAAQVAATLGGMAGSAAINAEEVRKARRRSPASLSAYDHYLLANEGRALFTKESVERGIEHANSAIALDPSLSRAYVSRAWLNYITVHYGAEFDSALNAMHADASRALEIDPNDAEARVALAFCLNGRARFEESRAQTARALQENPNSSQVLAVSAAMQAWNGNPEQAAELADRVMRLDPWMTAENLNCVKDAYFFARRFEDVISVVSRIPQDARGRGSRLLLTLSCALLGRKTEAERARAELLAAYPEICAELLLNQDWIFARAEDEALLLDGFRAAGLPICASGPELRAMPNSRRLPECIKTRVG
jgi:TolB-like protein